MVDTATVKNNSIYRGELMASFKSFPQAMKELDVKRQTLYKWMAEGRIKYKMDTIGERSIFKFTEEEIQRVKSLFKKKREKGKSII